MSWFLIAGAVGPQLLDRRIDMGGGDMGTDGVKRCKLLFERGQYGLCALVVGRCLELMYQGEIPLLSCPPRAPQRPSGNGRSSPPIALIPYGKLQRETT